MSHTNINITLRKPIVLVGLMGAGKTTIGKRLSGALGLPFIDSDHEIVEAAGCSIGDIFEIYGEAIFRDLEQRVLLRLVGSDPCIIATGGGAFINPVIREAIKEKATSVWLKADLDVLLERVSRRDTRPLLKSGDKGVILSKLMDERYPIYAQSDITIDSNAGLHEAVVESIIGSLRERGEMPETLKVELGKRSYDIVVGERLLAQAGEWIAPLIKGPVIIVSDETVARFYLHRLTGALEQKKIRSRSIILKPGEGTKSLASFGELMELLLEQKPDRDTTLIALGGGVIGDLTGFAASVLLRGVHFIQIPTTLLSQVDSSVGGKTGINSKWGKNLIGAFHQPKLVLIDVATLSTLPKRELLAGYAETVKYGLISDAGFFGWLEKNGAVLLAGDAAVQTQAILKSCAAKAAIVAADEHENNVRALLNFGHTFGHALEAETGYSDALLHGEAVAIGMVLAFETSVKMGLCPQADLDRVLAHYKAVGLLSSPRAVRQAWDIQALADHFTRDKKNKDGKLTFVLTRGIGKAFITQEVNIELVRDVLAKACTA